MVSGSRYDIATPTTGRCMSTTQEPWADWVGGSERSNFHTFASEEKARGDISIAFVLDVLFLREVIQYQYFVKRWIHWLAAWHRHLASQQTCFHDFFDVHCRLQIPIGRGWNQKSPECQHLPVETKAKTWKTKIDTKRSGVAKDPWK